MEKNDVNVSRMILVENNATLRTTADGQVARLKRFLRQRLQIANGMIYCNKTSRSLH